MFCAGLVKDVENFTRRCKLVPLSCSVSVCLVIQTEVTEEKLESCTRHSRCKYWICISCPHFSSVVEVVALNASAVTKAEKGLELHLYTNYILQPNLNP
jgi:hypothetical protein